MRLTVITVEAAQVLVNIISSELVTNAARKQIIDLSSTTRNPLDFPTPMAGVTPTDTATSGSCDPREQQQEEL